MDFKVGQKVTVVGQQYDYMNSIGHTGVITYVGSSPWPYEVDNKWWYNADELKEVKGMQKSELKTGYLVQLANGKWATIVRDCGCTYGTKDMWVYLDGSGWDTLDYHNEDLTYNDRYPEDYQIQKVATCEYMRQIIKGVPVEKLTDFKVLWQRENHKKQQLTELVSKLQKQLKDATDELEEM